MELPKIAILGAGIFAKYEYIPKLSEISHLVTLKSIWSRTQESARGAVDMAKIRFPDVECKWGDAGLDEIIEDASIVAVVVVLAAQFQVDLSLRLLKAGKHVLQEKPAASSITELETALSSYNSLPRPPIWAVAENYRFQPAFEEGAKLMGEIGDLVNFQVIVELPMDNNSNPFFSTPWRHSFNGGFILDAGVHYVAALRRVVGCEVTSVAAMTSHVDPNLPPPDTISSVIQLENGRSGVLVTVVTGKSHKMVWRFVGLKGTFQIDFVQRKGKLGYSIRVFTGMGKEETKTSFSEAHSGVADELKSFVHDVSQANRGLRAADPRMSILEGARDLAVIDAILESGKRGGDLVQVHPIPVPAYKSTLPSRL